MESPELVLPPHIEDLARVIARLNAEHRQQASRLDHIVDRVTALLGRPAFLGFVTVATILWVGVNLVMVWTTGDPLDAPPFPWLAGVLSLMAVYTSALTLMTQRRADRLAGYRDQMGFELAILSEQKAAKIISLLEELRRDSPEITNRVDDEALAMATPADTGAMLAAIKSDQGVIPPPG